MTACRSRIESKCSFVSVCVGDVVRQIPEGSERRAKGEALSTDVRTEALLAEMDAAEEWVAPVSGWVRWQTGLSILFSYGVVGFSVGWDLIHPLMLGLYGVSTAGLLLSAWQTRRAERRVQSVLDHREDSCRARSATKKAPQV